MTSTATLQAALDSSATGTHRSVIRLHIRSVSSVRSCAFISSLAWWVRSSRQNRNDFIWARSRWVRAGRAEALGDLTQGTARRRAGDHRQDRGPKSAPVRRPYLERRRRSHARCRTAGSAVPGGGQARPLGAGSHRQGSLQISITSASSSGKQMWLACHWHDFKLPTGFPANLLHIRRYDADIGSDTGPDAGVRGSCRRAPPARPQGRDSKIFRRHGQIGCRVQLCFARGRNGLGLLLGLVPIPIPGVGVGDAGRRWRSA